MAETYYIVPTSGGQIDNSLPGQPPVVGGGPIVPPPFLPPDDLPPGSIWPPIFPVDPGYGQGRPMPPHVGNTPPGSGPGSGGEVDNTLPSSPKLPKWMFCWIPGYGTRWVRLATHVDNTLPTPPTPTPKRG